jgi:hypothetical protein
MLTSELKIPIECSKTLLSFFPCSTSGQSTLSTSNALPFLQPTFFTSRTSGQCLGIVLAENTSPPVKFSAPHYYPLIFSSLSLSRLSFFGPSLLHPSVLFPVLQTPNALLEFLQFVSVWDFPVRVCAHMLLRAANKFWTIFRIYINPLKPSGDYMSQLLQQSITLHFVFVGFACCSV